MADVQHCLAMADEAERLAAIVSYGRDKTRLRQQAESWREQAHAIESQPMKNPVSDAGSHRNVVMRWLRGAGA